MSEDQNNQEEIRFEENGGTEPTPVGTPDESGGEAAKTTPSGKRPRLERLGAFAKGLHLKNPRKWPGGLWAALAVVVLLIIVGIDAMRTLPANAPIDGLAVEVIAEREFLDTGVLELSGLGKYSVKELEEGLSFSPSAVFTVKKAGNRVVLTIPERRNAAYIGTFQLGEIKAVFGFNGPPLTVRIGNKSSAVQKHDILELVFSEQVDIYSLEENLTILPKTAYSLSYDLNRVTIMPDVEWVATDNYQITIGANYASKTGKEFADQQSLTFKVPAPSNSVVVHTPRVNFRSGVNFVLEDGADMTLGFDADALKANVPVLVDTYRMESLEKYKSQGHIYLHKDVKLDSLEKLDTNAFLIKDGENHFNVPGFGEGAYILSAVYMNPNTGEETEVRTSYLITGLSVYMQASARETMMWLNKGDTGGALAGYSVHFADETEPVGTTDENGLLLVPHEEKEGENAAPTTFSIIDPNGKLVYYDNSNLYSESYHSERFYSYLFLDRTIYRPEDTVSFWGFVKPFRYNKKTLPDKVNVVFDADGLNLTVEADLAPSGVYHGEIPLERIKSTQYSVQAELNFPSDEEGKPGAHHVLETEYISVKDFQKPTFVLSSETDKKYYGPNDTVTVTASASFYDGTPLPFYPLEVSYHDLESAERVELHDIKTDASGKATFSFPAGRGNMDLYSDKSSQSNRYMVQIANDGEQVTHVKNYQQFPSDTLIDITVEPQPDGKNLQLTARAYKLNMESQQLKTYMDSNQDDYAYYSLDNDRLLQIARGAPTDVELRMVLNWSYTDTKKIRHRNSQSGQGGDYVSFANSYSLDLALPESQIATIDDWETKEKRIAVATKDGVAVVRDLIYLPEGGEINFDEKVRLRGELAYKDGKENRCDAYVQYPVGTNWDYSEEGEKKPEPIPGYSFAIVDTTTGADLTPSEEYYRYVSMDAGKQTRFQLLLDGKPVETKGTILYSILQDGLYEHHFVKNDGFDFQYKLAYGRNVGMVAAYFDGEKTHYIKQLDLEASSDSLGIEIDVTPDKIGYRPGEAVSLRVRATDSTGNGVAGNLCVAVVDESIFALSEQYVDVLNGLYNDLNYLQNSVSRYCTTYRDDPYPDNMWDGGKGGDGGAEFFDSYRKNFKDTALFLPTTTDAGGNGVVNFTLPDNTTSWRITAVEVGTNLKAGYSKSNIISSLPFFCKPVMTSKYIDGDDVSMLVQGHGTLLEKDSPISYSVTLTGDRVSETLTGEGKSYQAMEFNFGKLPIGTYTVAAKAQYSGYSDTVELPLAVIKSNLELVINKQIEIKETLDISAVRYPVTLTLYDKTNEAFLASINSLFGHYCMQANQRMSRFVAKRVIRQTVEGGGDIPYYIADGNDSASDMQNSDGGIGYLSGEESEPVLTTYVLLIAKDQFNLKAMSAYYRSQLRDKTLSKKQHAACYLGLAAIGDTTTKELLDALGEKDLPLDVQAYIIAGLAYLGEKEQAGKLYNEHLAARIKTVDKSDTKRLDWDRDAAAIWIAASRLEHPDADVLSLYFGGDNWRYQTLFECMIYVTNYNRQVTITSFDYSVKGADHQADLGLIGMKTLVLSKSDLESLRFQKYPDSLKAVAYYVGEPTEIGLEQSENMEIKKSVRAMDDNTYEVTLAIHLSDKAPKGQYDINDWVPSNSRLYSADQSVKIGADTIYFSTEDEGQKLFVSFLNTMQQDRTILFRYRVRQTYQSQAMLDTTYMIHGDSGENCNTEKEAFKPTPTGERTPVVKVQDKE